DAPSSGDWLMVAKMHPARLSGSGSGTVDTHCGVMAVMDMLSGDDAEPDEVYWWGMGGGFGGTDVAFVSGNRTTTDGAFHGVTTNTVEEFTYTGWTGAQKNLELEEWYVAARYDDTANTIASLYSRNGITWSNPNTFASETAAAVKLGVYCRIDGGSAAKQVLFEFFRVLDANFEILSTRVFRIGGCDDAAGCQ
ncbi:MAG: hypothetical protein L0271_09520, partial [Gemmatimonadetes bacterium]|nr:hypothetical protein [Gemmatimonadota bacterium]